MHYPWFYVPVLTSPMLIAAIAVFHVLVSHYAVGGGIFLAAETRYAYRTRNTDYLNYLHRHAWFFVLLTVVFGAITGVGIWWTIGVASPLATQTLIHTFVFAWGMEYAFFVVEIVSAFIFVYMWGRMRPRTHAAIGTIYAVAAWISLVLITGITSFMLNPGAWPQHRSFWVGFFNPQLLPQVVARTGGALVLATLYVYLHASFAIKDVHLRSLIGQRSARPALLGAAMLIVGGLWWYAAMPPSAQAALVSTGALNVIAAVVLGVTVAVFVMLYAGAYRHPTWITPGFAILLFVFGLAGVTTGEFLREAVRKPYIIYNVVLSNQIFPEEIPRLRRTGILEGGIWTKAYVERDFPGLLTDGAVDQAKLAALTTADKRTVGHVLFQYHCNDCHAAQIGYTAVGELLRGWTPEMIDDLVRNPEKYHFFMPPWAGTPEEAALLTTYLESIAPPRPGDMNYGDGD
jgi:cytochrome d ubiquinol oxidase subunit I